MRPTVLLVNNYNRLKNKIMVICGESIKAKVKNVRKIPDCLRLRLSEEEKVYYTNL
jgi:hypothetical protein